ncbi:hypothetical protein PLICRDRAFT_141195 [Plicaturopsis crispa FD-325 SS-3]|nr:hypothetical protein PLICRDRAFT_141195 [Plicaturopsis crispa FD-325 SS-3]
MAFFCLPIVFGCPTKIKPEGDLTPRICPKCHNVSVIPAKSRMWFELCFVPLIPLKATHLWMCTICQWNVPLQPNWEPAIPGAAYQNVPLQHHGPPPNGPNGGYQPTYLNQHKG